MQEEALLCSLGISSIDGAESIGLGGLSIGNRTKSCNEEKVFLICSFWGWYYLIPVGARGSLTTKPRVLRLHRRHSK